MKRRYWFFSFPQWFSDFKILSMLPVVNKVKESHERNMCVFIFTSLYVLFWPGALFSLLKKNYRSKKTKKRKGVALRPRENWQGPSCIEFRTWISNEKRFIWNLQVGAEPLFQRIISLKMQAVDLCSNHLWLKFVKLSEYINHNAGQ